MASLYIDRIEYAGANFAPDGGTLATAINQQLTMLMEDGIAAVNAQLMDFLAGVFSEIRAKHSTPWAPGNPWNSPQAELLRRTGGGLKSIERSMKVTVDNESGMASISTGDMTVHEIGGTMYPTRSRYMTIPSRFALTAQGTPIYSSALQWGKKNTFVGRTKRNNLVIFLKERNKTITPLYLLKTRVSVPPRLGLGETFNKHVGYFQSKAIEELERALA